MQDYVMRADGRALWRDLAATGVGIKDIARYLGVTDGTVGRWRSAKRVANPDRHEPAIRSFITGLARSQRVESERQLRIDLRQTMASASALLNRLTTLTPDELLTAPVGRLACADANIRLTVAPAFRGRTSRTLGLPLHYLVGVDILDYESQTGMKPAEHVLTVVANTLKQEWRGLGLHLRHGIPPEFAKQALPTIVLQVPVIERPRAVDTADRLRSRNIKDRLVVVAPVYGYGEMLAALLSEALGMSLADLRYEESPPSPNAIGRSADALRDVRRAARKERERRAIDLLGSDTSSTALCIAGESLLSAVERDLYGSRASTTVIAIKYGPRWARLGEAVHATPVEDQRANGAAAIELAQRCAPGSIIVNYDDDDVSAPDGEIAEYDEIADHTMITAIEILDKLGVAEAYWRPGWLKSTADENRKAFDYLRRQPAQRSSRVTITQ